MNSLSARNSKESLYSLLKGSVRKPKRLNFSSVWGSGTKGSGFTSGGLLVGDGQGFGEASANRPRGGTGAMVQGLTAADYWLSSNMREIIDCPHQPGNLKITKNACLKRHEASEKTSPETVEQANLFYYTVGQGLLRCKTCSIPGKLQ
ncbi:MAG TPA: hypothetical protein VK564_04230 [Thermodesulfobacteriota bacterium]|nr:hypothetical protein [Thermodesulfobacteriota bacterium]